MNNVFPKLITRFPTKSKPIIEVIESMRSLMSEKIEFTSNEGVEYWFTGKLFSLFGEKFITSEYELLIWLPKGTITLLKNVITASSVRKIVSI